METHYLLLNIIAAIAVVVWLCGLIFLLRLRRPQRDTEEFFHDDLDMPSEPNHDVVRGSTMVSGQPTDLSARAASQLAQHGLPSLGPVKVLDQSENSVAFETLGNLGMRWMQRGTLEFHSLENGQTQVTYRAEVPRRQRLLVGAWIIQILGLFGLVGGFAALHLWIAPNPRPAVHWQSVQMVQVVHLLWPPFLFGALYRRTQTHVRNTLDSLINNLPYVK